MDSFSERNSLRPPPPDRTAHAVLPPCLQRLLIRLIEESWQTLEYSVGPVPSSVLADAGDLVPPAPDEEGRQWDMWAVRQLRWNQVFDAVEMLLEGSSHLDEEVNDCLVRHGVAWEMVDGHFWPYEPARAEIEESTGIDLTEEVDESVFGGALEPALRQYQKAVQKLNSRPADLEGAVADAVNALEGAVGAITGSKKLSDGVRRLGLDGPRSPLGKAIEMLHNYGSAMPGIRHGAHSSSDLKDAEARAVVRASGALLAWVAQGHRDRDF